MGCKRSSMCRTVHIDYWQMSPWKHFVWVVLRACLDSCMFTHFDFPVRVWFCDRKRMRRYQVLVVLWLWLLLLFLVYITLRFSESAKYSQAFMYLEKKFSGLCMCICLHPLTVKPTLPSGISESVCECVHQDGWFTFAMSFKSRMYLNILW